MQQLKDEQYRLGIELEEHTKADHDHHIHISTVFSLCRRIGSIFDSSEVREKRAILNYLLQNPVVSSKNLEFTLRKPFDTLLEVSTYPIGLALVDNFRTINWAEEYLFPIIALKELESVV